MKSKKKTEIKRKIRRVSYRGLNNNFTQVANTMVTYIKDPYDFKVYFYLCYRFNRDLDYSFPSLNTIAKDTGISLSRVKKSIKNLESQRFIKRYKREGDEWMNNCYFIKYVEEEIEEAELDEEEIIEEWEDDNDWEIIDKTTKE